MENNNILDDNNQMDESVIEEINNSLECDFNEIIQMVDNIDIDNSENVDQNHIQRECNNDINYLGLKDVSFDINYHASQTKEGRIYLCAYQINNISKNPFLEFIMVKGHENHPTCPDMFNFPSIAFKETDDLYYLSDIIIKYMCVCYKVRLKYEYRGFIQDGNDFYVFMENKTIIESYRMTRMDDLWIILVDEIINHKKACNFLIKENVISFFEKYPNFLKLTNIKQEIYDVPVVAYIGVQEKMMEFVGTFGNWRQTDNYLIGPYYYFTDYNHSFELANGLSCNEYDKNKNKAIVRFALFLGNMAIRKNIIEKGDKCFQQYDSIYINNAGLPFWILDDYDRQIPISYHSIGKNNNIIN